jgi:hypothetical protein
MYKISNETLNQLSTLSVRLISLIIEDNQKSFPWILFQSMPTLSPCLNNFPFIFKVYSDYSSISNLNFKSTYPLWTYISYSETSIYWIKFYKKIFLFYLHSSIKSFKNARVVPMSFSK